MKTRLSAALKVNNKLDIEDTIILADDDINNYTVNIVGTINQSHIMMDFNICEQVIVIDEIDIIAASFNHL